MEAKPDRIKTFLPIIVILSFSCQSLLHSEALAGPKKRKTASNDQQVSYARIESDHDGVLRTVTVRAPLGEVVFKTFYCTVLGASGGLIAGTAYAVYDIFRDVNNWVHYDVESTLGAGVFAGAAISGILAYSYLSAPTLVEEDDQHRIPGSYRLSQTIGEIRKVPCNAGEDCGICKRAHVRSKKEPDGGGRRIVIMPCKHEFCEECYLGHLNSVTGSPLGCPMCRRPHLPANQLAEVYMPVLKK